MYPAQIKKSQHPVEYLAQLLDVLEINTSFYGHVKPEWGKLWCRDGARRQSGFPVHRQAEPGVHPFADRGGGEHVGGDHPCQSRRTSIWPRPAWIALLDEGMLGAVLAQFPISFKNTYANRDYLDTVIEKFQGVPAGGGGAAQQLDQRRHAALLRQEECRLLQH